jgi:hypothetical protein
LPCFHPSAFHCRCFSYFPASSSLSTPNPCTTPGSLGLIIPSHLPKMRSIIAFAASLAVAGLADAQVQYQIKPETVPLNIRATWCTSQKQQCPLLCIQMLKSNTGVITTSNTCDPKTLTYNCICKDGLTPNATEYSQTLPFYICQEWQNQCVTACGQALACQASCREDHPCGAQNPTRVTTTSSSSEPTAATATSAPTGSSNNFGELGAVKPTPAAGGGQSSAVSSYGQACGLAIVLTGFFTGFAALL